MENICSRELCTACAACLNICPRDAIIMKETHPCGYMYPMINRNLCIDCGLCVKVCPVNAPLQLNEPLKAYAAISSNSQNLISSASGGASSVMSDYIISKGGVVYGCAQYDYKNIKHSRIDNLKEAKLLKQSKYVQSGIGYVYRAVKDDLKQGRLVLFTGTPCQIAGLRNFLRKDYDNLFLVDLVCHGVPSQKLLIDNIEEILDKNNITGSNINVVFRKKTPEISNDTIQYGVFLYKDGCEISLPHRDTAFLHNDYITAFMSGVIFRTNCYSCPYAQSKRSGDLTIADFWGLGDSKIPTEKGVSLILTNTIKGMQMMKMIASHIYFEERSLEEAIQGNGQLNNPSPCPIERPSFMMMYPQNKGLAYKNALRNYKKLYIRRRRKLKIKSILQQNELMYNWLSEIYKKIKKR